MGRIRVLIVLTFASVLLGPIPSGMAAQNEVRVDVEPTTAAPGDAITVLSTCGGGSVSSDAFGTTDLVSLSRDDKYTSGASVAVDSGAEQGVYDVEVACRDGRSGSTELVVSDSGVGTGDGAMAGGVDRAWVAAGAMLVFGAGLGFVVSRRRTAG